MSNGRYSGVSPRTSSQWRGRAGFAPASVSPLGLVGLWGECGGEHSRVQDPRPAGRLALRQFLGRNPSAPSAASRGPCRHRCRPRGARSRTTLPPSNVHGNRQTSRPHSRPRAERSSQPGDPPPHDKSAKLFYGDKRMVAEFLAKHVFGKIIPADVAAHIDLDGLQPGPTEHVDPKLRTLRHADLVWRAPFRDSWPWTAPTRLEDLLADEAKAFLPFALGHQSVLVSEAGEAEELEHVTTAHEAALKLRYAADGAGGGRGATGAPGRLGGSGRRDVVGEGATGDTPQGAGRGPPSTILPKFKLASMRSWQSAAWSAGKTRPPFGSAPSTVHPVGAATATVSWTTTFSAYPPPPGDDPQDFRPSEIGDDDAAHGANDGGVGRRSQRGRPAAGEPEFLRSACTGASAFGRAAK